MKNRIILIIAIIPILKLSALDLNDQIDRWNNYEITSAVFLSSLDNQEKELSPGYTDMFFYEKSIINLYRGIIFLRDDKSEESIRFFESAMENSSKALEIKEKSDYYRVLSEAGSYIMLQKGISYIIKQSKKVDENAKMALKLDPKNVKATIISAGGLLNAPAIFGGNKKRGRSTLITAIQTDDITNEEKFQILIMLAESTRDVYYIKEALKIYPNNTKALELSATLVR